MDRRAFLSASLALGLSSCCSAAAGPALGVAAATTPSAAVTNNGGGGTSGPSAAASPYVLWCSRAGGTACGAASSALGVSALDATGIPEELLGPMRDGENDCVDPDVARVTALLQGPLGITPTNWHDNVGAQLARESVPQTFSGGGCTNCCFTPTQPAVKVHAVDGPNGVRFLVRVWEVGEF